MTDILYNMKILFLIIFMISISIFVILLLHKSKHTDGIISSGGVAIVTFIGEIVLYVIR